GGTGPASTPASGGASSGDVAPLAKLSSIKVGEAISATGPDGAKIIIARPTATTVAAFSAVCTHQACIVAPAGKELDCPCHGSVYNATTGEVINGPAPRPLPTVNVTLSGDNVVAG
ncbi:MAG: Rieske (2Fe-2S) protein, partial [Actinomycetota bacterium]|nr:Rieske (2Fe-2S) protein [Actinomycetota bacterium]